MSGALTLFVAALLALAAGHKAFDRERLVPAAARLAGTRLPAAALLLALAASVELLATIALLIPALRSGGAVAASMVWFGYAAVLARHHGQTLDCGCELVARPRPVDSWAIARPALLAILAGFIAVFPAPGWTLDAPFAALALLALWLAAGELHAIPKLAESRK